MDWLKNFAVALPSLVLGQAANWPCSVQRRVDSGKGQDRTLSPLSAFWPPVFASEQDVGPPKG